MTEIGTKIRKLCLKAKEKGYVLIKEDYGLSIKVGEVYKSPKKQICPLGLLILGRECTSELPHKDLLLQGVSVEYWEGFIEGWEGQENRLGSKESYEDGCSLRREFSS